MCVYEYIPTLHVFSATVISPVSLLPVWIMDIMIAYLIHRIKLFYQISMIYFLLIQNMIIGIWILNQVDLIEYWIDIYQIVNKYIGVL